MILLENVKKIYKAKSGDVTAVDNANLQSRERRNIWCYWI